MGALATAIVGVQSPAVKAQQADSATPPAPSTTTRPAPPKDATSAFDVNFGAAITSDYNYRGYTLSDHRPSASSNIEATYNIFFAGVNTASVDMPKLSQFQMTNYVGIRPTFGQLTVEAGIAYYSYPGSAIDISYPEYYVAPTYALTPKLTVGVSAYFAPDYSRTGAWENYNAIQAKYTLEFRPVVLRRVRPPRFRHHHGDAVFAGLQAAGLHVLESGIFLRLQGRDVRSALFRNDAVETKLFPDNGNRAGGYGIERLRSRRHCDIVLEHQPLRPEIRSFGGAGRLKGLERAMGIEPTTLSLGS